MSNPTPANPAASAQTTGVQGITEADIAHYLANNPGFFERHAELLSTVQLTSPHGKRAVSLQERQMEMLRERNRGLEHRIMDMVRNSQDNVALFDRLHRYTRNALVPQDSSALPHTLVASLQHEFLVPQVGLRLWDLPPGFEGHDYAGEVTDDVKSFANSLALPYCGMNSGFEASEWLDDGGSMQSLAMIPLRDSQRCFGMLVLGSPDATRYTASMGTEFLVRVGEITGAALSRLYRPAEPAAQAAAADAAAT